MEIRKLELDIDKEVLKVNGEIFKTPVKLISPGPSGWPLEKIYNVEEAKSSIEKGKKLSELEIHFHEASDDAPKV